MLSSFPSPPIVWSFDPVQKSACWNLHPRGSCCCSGRFSQDPALSLTLCYPLAFGLGFLSRNSRAGFLWIHVQAAERVPAKSFVLPCSAELYGAAEVREKNGRSDLRAGAASASPRSTWATVALCLLAARSGPADTKTTGSFLAILPVCRER